jgi:hypothetical protein
VGLIVFGDAILVVLIGKVVNESDAIVGNKRRPVHTTTAVGVPPVFETRNYVCIDSAGILMNVERFVATINRIPADVITQSSTNIIFERGIWIRPRNSDAVIGGMFPRWEVEKTHLIGKHANIHITVVPNIRAVSIRSLRKH